MVQKLSVKDKKQKKVMKDTNFVLKIHQNRLLLPVYTTHWVENIVSCERFSLAHPLGEDVRSDTLWK